MTTTITGLPNGTTPLDGTERVPMDQAGVTVDATTQDIADLAISPHVAAADPHPGYALESSLATVATSGAYSDLTGKPTLGGAAALDVGTTAGTVAAGDDSRFTPIARSTSTAGVLPATSFAAITYGATVNLDMDALDGQYRTISLTGDLTFTSSNRAAGRMVVIRLIADASDRTLTFPADWKFLGTKPASIAASKTGVLSLTFFGTADADCVAAWGVQG